MSNYLDKFTLEGTDLMVRDVEARSEIDNLSQRTTTIETKINGLNSYSISYSGTTNTLTIGKVV